MSEVRDVTRKPKVGEVWTSDLIRPLTCVVDEPDGYGSYVWRNASGNYWTGPATHLKPPQPPKPAVGDALPVLFIPITADGDLLARHFLIDHARRAARSWYAQEGGDSVQWIARFEFAEWLPVNP